MRKTTRTLALALASTLVLTACGEAPDDANGAEPPDDVDFAACLVTDEGGVDDRSFNETAWAGVERAEEELGVTARLLESQSEADYEPNIQAFLGEDCDIIVTVGFLLGEVTETAAQDNPDQNFAIVDFAYEADYDNLRELTFQTDEAAFMAGYVAAGVTESGRVGTYGGIPIPTVTIFMDGFLAGVNHYNEVNGDDVQVLGWDGSDGQFTNDFTSLDLGRSVTETLMDNGADIIMPVAGPVGGGSAAAIQDRGEGLLIWVDTDGYESTDFGDIMFTSVMKQMDVAVFDADGADFISAA